MKELDSYTVMDVLRLAALGYEVSLHNGHIECIKKDCDNKAERGKCENTVQSI